VDDEKMEHDRLHYFFGINQVLLLAFGVWNIFALILPGIVIAIGFSKYKLME
jgi:hypothetical protein